jgi:NAD(P)-dependent dehydrogenase (short-subunit alcohol dehydrogenase family)
MGLDWGRSVAVVTGASSGIGRALSLELARRGSAVAISDLDLDGLERTARACRAAGRSALKVSAQGLDVADRGRVQAYADEVVQEFGSVNLVFNNAGVALSAPVAETPFEDLDWLMGIDFGGVVNGSKAFLPHLIRSGNGHLVNISSVFGLVAPPDQAAYSSAKFAVRGFTESLRQEMIAGGFPVDVHCVHPGGIRTSIAANARYPRGDGAEQTAGFEKLARTSPEAAATAILRGVERKRARILVGADAYFIEATSRLLGPHYMTILGWVSRRRAED